MRSSVHPTHKTKYRVGNWPAYDRALVTRGDITLWISQDAIDSWKPAPSGKRGGQRRFSDVAIETALALRLVYHLPLRQAEGFLRSLLDLMAPELEAPDHTTLSRRAKALDVKLDRPARTGALHLIVDSSGLAIFGEGEWAAAKHGGSGRRGWKKLHLGVDRAGLIVARVLTDGTADDAATTPELLGQVEGRITRFTADAAYDTIGVYKAAGDRGAKVVVPPTKTATQVRRRRPQSSPRDRTIHRVQKVGRRRWKKESAYHRQARVENAFFRYKSILGDRVRSRHPNGQRIEVAIACNILNRMTELGRPKSSTIGI